MKITEAEIAPNAKRFRPDPFRLVLLALVVCSIYGGGILSALWAGNETVKAAHSTGDVPMLPWILAFCFVVSGMLSLIYGVFFRPREIRLTDSAVAILWWDGNGKVMRRDKLESVETKGKKIILHGAGETVILPSIFVNMKSLGEELKGWTTK